MIFDEIFAEAAYISNADLKDVKLYTSDKYDIVEPKISAREGYFQKVFPSAYRKLIFKKQYGTGIIIGQTKKSEGKYYPGSIPGYFGDPGDYEQAYTAVETTYTFWVVATGMNKTVLVPKK